MKEIYRSPPFNCNGYVAFTVVLSDGIQKTVLEHREKMEQELGRKLKSSEIIHHKNGNRTDNCLSNLEIMQRDSHARLHREPFRVSPKSFFCPQCGKTFTRLERFVKHSKKQGKNGPYCSKICSGTAIRERQILEGKINLGGGRPRTMPE